MKRPVKKILILAIVASALFGVILAAPKYAENENPSNQVTNEVTSEVTIKNGWDAEKKYYYINSKPVKGFKKIGNKTYYFNENTGVKVTGLKKIKGSYYYFDNKGVMKTGWQKINKNKYYFLKTKKNNGKAVTGNVKVGKKFYKFKSNGKYVKKISEMTYRVKEYKYSSPTKYLILVDKKTHKVGIYKGKKGKWKNIKTYSCTLGAPGTPTPKGKFYVGGGKTPSRVTYFDSAKVRCWYATRITGNYFFHSVLYTQASRPVRVTSGRLGANLSHGCVRLKLENAKWIYNNIPNKTRVVIY